MQTNLGKHIMIFMPSLPFVINFHVSSGKHILIKQCVKHCTILLPLFMVFRIFCLLLTSAPEVAPPTKWDHFCPKQLVDGEHK